MATVVRAELSQKNKYWISKHRYYELKHFCLQYPDWKKAYSDLCDIDVPLSMAETTPTDILPGDPATKRATMQTSYLRKIKLIEGTAFKADPCLDDYIIKGVTEGRSYTYLKTVLGIPCGKDMYYDRYRRFFGYLAKEGSKGILIDDKMYKIISKCFINSKQHDASEVFVIYEDGSRERIWTFNPMRHNFDSREFIGKSKLEAVFYCDRKKPRSMQLI